MHTNRIDYAQRASDERVAARQASDASARHAHLDLAMRFDQLAAALGEADAKCDAGEGAGHLHSGAGLFQF